MYFTYGSLQWGAGEGSDRDSKGGKNCELHFAVNVVKKGEQICISNVEYSQEGTRKERKIHELRTISASVSQRTAMRTCAIFPVSTGNE